ncbi:endonuclease domain-containing protein [Streptomyces anulatus]|uniref:endonuclease domain-containing protein n=1 Tax=Streptomyces anulatus TaxID=1892 RepID=UPI0035DEB2FA
MTVGARLSAWACTQCGGALRWTRRGGNRRRVCTECAPSDRWKALVRRYGVDPHMFAAMYFEQDGRCALYPCMREAKVVDHDHRSGRIRGLLCQGCNVALGFLEEEQWRTSALQYLSGTS